MAVTPVGNPYVESSDLVANYPGASEALAERIDIVGVNPFANAAARDAAIPSPVQGQMCSLNDDNKGYRYDGSAWVLFSGAGDANFTNAATGTYTDGSGISYKYITFTGSGSLVVDQAGFADILVVGGGGGGGSVASKKAYGGAGGMVYIENHYFQAATFTATIGAGGSTTNDTVSDQGNTSSLDQIIGAGGGSGFSSSSMRFGIGGGSGGGSTLSANYVGVGIPGMGNNGGFANPAAGGGAGSAASGGTRGAGSANSITGSSVTYSTGGDSGTPVTVNSGNGHGDSTAGDSGVIIVRVVV